MVRVSNIVNAKNIRHAIGELLLIVAGILIALAISDWHSQKIQREQELAVLGEIRTALTVDLQVLERSLGEWNATMEKIKALIEVLETEPPYDPSFAQLFGAPYGIRRIELNTAAYESLKSMGLQTVLNPELRLSIAKVFDHHYETLAFVNEVDTNVILGIMRPYYLVHFSDLEFLQSASPLDFEFIVQDSYFQNIVEYRLVVLNTNQLNAYARAAEDIQATLKMLDNELNR
jgi:Zn-dependent protease with chaperone function